MASYRDKVRADLDRWIGAGLVAADKRDAILRTLPESGRIDAATAMAWIGGLLLGVAAISFIGANWDALPRLARFVLVLTFFIAAAGAGAWAVRARRPVLSNIALMLAALLFAAAIGLTGQIFDIVGSPQAACYSAGVAAFALALAGRSTGAAVVGLVFIGLGDFAGQGVWMFDHDAWRAMPWMILAAPLSAWLTLRWGSTALAHLSALGLIYCFFWFAVRREADPALLFLFSILFTAFMLSARWLFQRGKPFASVFYGWFAWAAFAFFIPAGYAALLNGTWGEAHRVAWLAAAGAVIALGRHDRHAMVTFVGVLGMIGAIFALTNDLGLNLLAAAGVFLICAIAALMAGVALRRKAGTA